MPHSANENSMGPSAPSSEPDAHGQAALILAESILHALVEKATFTEQEGVAVVQSACEIKTEVATQSGESDRRIQESLELLKRIAISFEADLR